MLFLHDTACGPQGAAALSGGAQIIDMMALVIDANKVGVTVESESALLIAALLNIVLSTS